MSTMLTDYRTAYSTDSELLDDIDYPQRVHWFKESYSRVKTGMIYAPHKVAEKVLDTQLLADLKQRGGKTAFIFASGNSNLASEGRKTKESQLSYDYKILPLTLTQVYAGRIAAQCGAQDYVTTDASACASSLKVLSEVKYLIEHQGFDRVIVLGFEDQVNNMTLKFFGEAKACLTYENELQDGVMPSAFDSKNYGFYVGQGAVLAVFESEKIAKTSHARLVGAASASENLSNPIGQRDDGEGFSKAITFSLHQEKTEKAKIKIIKTHGTGTKSNNQAEKNGILNVFDHDFIATSFKPTIGHTMGASGLLESLLLLDNLKNGVVPAIPNRSEKDDVFLSHDCQTDEGMFLSLAAGMGNIYSAAIFDARM